MHAFLANRKATTRCQEIASQPSKGWTKQISDLLLGFGVRALIIECLSLGGGLRVGGGVFVSGLWTEMNGHVLLVLNEMCSYVFL